MDSFENSWGWMYWTWQTESAYQWSYKKGLEHGMIPKVAYKRSFKCGDEIPDWGARGLPEHY
jgi:glucan 1,3-beta-glucosidase